MYVYMPVYPYHACLKRERELYIYTIAVVIEGVNCCALTDLNQDENEEKEEGREGRMAKNGKVIKHEKPIDAE